LKAVNSEQMRKQIWTNSP